MDQTILCQGYPDALTNLVLHYRYLAVYHHRDPVLKTFNVLLAQSFDLVSWEFLRRLITNADMPTLARDNASSGVLLSYEKFHSTKTQWLVDFSARVL